MIHYQSQQPVELVTIDFSKVSKKHIVAKAVDRIPTEVHPIQQEPQHHEEGISLSCPSYFRWYDVSTHFTSVIKLNAAEYWQYIDEWRQYWTA